MRVSPRQLRSAKNQFSVARKAAAAIHHGGEEQQIDVALYADVLRRHRLLVGVGVALSVVLAILSFVRISPSGIGFRSPEVWSNQATLVLTQQGAPELRSVLPTTAGNSPFADTGRFATLVDVYAAMATSDPVFRALRKRGLINDADLRNGASPITATAVLSTVGGLGTPMMTLAAKAESGPKATALTQRATAAFLAYVRERQLAAKIPPKDRILIRVVKSTGEPTLAKPRSKALSILVFLAGLISTAAVVFVRDNVAGGKGASALTAVDSPTEPAEVIVARAVSHSLSQSRSTLEPVPRGEPSAHDVPDRGQQRAPQTGPVVPTLGSSSKTDEHRRTPRQGRSANS